MLESEFDSEKISPMHTFRIKTIAVLIVGFLFSSTVEAQVNWAKRYFEIAVEHHLTGNNDEAIKAFIDSLPHNKKNATAHFYLALIYDRRQMGVHAIKHMLRAEKFFEAEGRDYWKERSRQRIEEYYELYKYSKEDFEK